MADAARSSSNRHSNGKSAGVAGATAGAPAAQMIQEVFLSPRVVDRQAFEDFAGSLRNLLEQAAGQADNLRAANADAQVARESLREVATRNQPKIEAAVKAMTVLEQRVAEAEGLLNSVGEAAAKIELARTDIERTLADRLAEAVATLEAAGEPLIDRVRGMGEDLAASCEAALASAEERLSDIEARATEATGPMEEQARRAQERLESAFDTLHRRASEHVTQAEERILAAVRPAAERAREIERRVEAACEAAVTRAEQRLADLDTRLAAAFEPIAVRTSEIERTLQTATDAVLARAQEQAAQIEARVEAAIARLAQSAEETDTRIAGLTQELDAAGIMVVAHHRESLETAAKESFDLVAAARSAVEATARTLEEDIRANVEQTHSAAEAIRPVVERAEALVRESATGQAVTLADLVAKAEKAQDEAALAARRLESLRQQADLAVSTLGESINDGAARIDVLCERGDDLQRHMEATRVTCADQAAALDAWRDDITAATSAAARLDTLLASLTTISGELRPWRGVLLEHKPEGALPKPLAELMNAVRGELAGDLATIATAMHQLTTRTVKVIEDIQPR